MDDMTEITAPKVDQLTADDLIGRTLTIKITSRKMLDKDQPQPLSLFFDGDNGKPYKPCKSMNRVLKHVWGLNSSSYVGKSLTLYRDDSVMFGGLKVGGIRISHMSDITAPVTLALTASKANKKPFTVKPLVVAAKAAAPVDAVPVAAPATVDDTNPLIASGAAAAAKGMEDFKEWGSKLTPEQRESVKGELGKWTAIARAVVK